MAVPAIIYWGGQAANWGYRSYRGYRSARAVAITANALAHANQQADELSDEEERDKTCEKCEQESVCPPHNWVEVERKAPDETKSLLDSMVSDLQSKPSKAEVMRGWVFEKMALAENQKIKDVEASSVKYRCSKCGDEQEIDILFKDGQIGESKSRNFKGIKSTKDQLARIADIQRQLNQKNKTNLQPLAKLDNTRPNIEDSAEYVKDHGVDVERLTLLRENPI